MADGDPRPDDERRLAEIQSTFVELLKDLRSYGSWLTRLLGDELGSGDDIWSRTYHLIAILNDIAAHVSPHPTSEEGYKRVPSVLQQLLDQMIALETRTRSDRELWSRFVTERTSAEEIQAQIRSYRTAFADLTAEREIILGRVLREEPRLETIVPGQKEAPAQFEFSDGILRIRHSSAAPESDVASSAKAARESLLEAGRDLIQTLQATNCDRRAVETIEKLQDKLRSQQDIVSLGIANIGCEMLCAALAKELPDAVHAMMRAYNTGIGMYVAQFPEWAKFAENAAAVDLTGADIVRVRIETEKIVANLKAVGATVDPEVPRTIALLVELIKDPAKATKRAVFAVVRTIENLVAKIYEHGGGLLEALLSGAKEGVKEGAKWAAKKAIIVALLSLAVEASGGIAPIAGKLSDTAWMKTATEIVVKKLGELD